MPHFRFHLNGNNIWTKREGHLFQHGRTLVSCLFRTLQTLKRQCHPPRRRKALTAQPYSQLCSCGHLLKSQVRPVHHKQYRSNRTLHNECVSNSLCLPPQPLLAFGFYLKGLIGSFYYSQLGFLIKRESWERLQANTAATHISIKSKEIKTRLSYCKAAEADRAFTTTDLWSYLMSW